MTFSAKTLSLLVLIGLGLSGLALLVTATGSGKRTRETRGPINLDDALRGILEGQGRAIQKLERAVRALQRVDGHRKESIEGAVRNVGLVRYDAFEDVGGRLSFSCALLDDKGNGVVVTSINGRQDTRVYAKPVTARKSGYNLSVEEEEAIKQALSGPREAVKAT
ncbi:MAG: DUF4446 family protein [Actinobacteria bacterium]|nr:MAG: DUF4446 family protein [Actinomycetota bacterium]